MTVAEKTMERVMCPRCGTRVAVTPTGKYREHESVSGRVCGSSGVQVDGAEADGADDEAPEQVEQVEQDEPEQSPAEKG